MDAENKISTDEQGTSLLDLFIVVSENIKILTIGPVLVGIIGLAATFAITPTYVARTVFLPPSQQQNSSTAAMQSLGALAGLTGAAGVKNSLDQYVSLMQSLTVANRIIDSHGLMKVYAVDNREDAYKRLSERVSIGAGKKDGLITVAVEDTDKNRAAKIANDYVEQFMRLTNDLTLTESQQRRAFFEGQLKKTRERLASAQRMLQVSGIGGGTLRAEPRAAAESYAALQAQVTVGEVRLQSMQNYMTPEASEYKAASANLRALRAQLDRIGGALPNTGVDQYMDRYRDYKYQETLFELFAKQYEIAKMDESRDGGVVQIVDAAQPPIRKSKPQRAKIAIAAAVGCEFLLLAYVLIRYRWNAAVKNSELEAKLMRLRKAWGRT